jgi:hypothetical protein
MPIATIGTWEFEMPDGWVSKESNGSDYFEALDGTKGLYVKAIELSDPKQTARELADYIQDVHFRSFADLDKSAWAVVDQLAADEHQFCRSRLDLYDSKANYRVLSLVLCDASKAIQVSVHDYFCENYPASRDDFSELEKSVCSVSAGV